MSETLPRRAVLTAGLGAAAALPAPALAQGTPELRWRLGSAFPKTLDILFGASESFSRIVAEATDGRFQIQPAGAGEIVSADGLIDAVGSGKVEVGHAPGNLALAKDPVFALASALATWVQFDAGFAAFGWGYMAGAVVGAFVGLALVAEASMDMTYLLFVGNNPAVVGHGGRWL